MRLTFDPLAEVRKMQRLACSILALAFLFASFLIAPGLGIESPQYTVVHTESDFELRLYREASWISATSGAMSFEKATREGFHRSFTSIWFSFLSSYRLFQYIQGANINNSRIAMTSPVLTRILPGAGPLHSFAYVISFFLPIKFQAAPPIPLPELNLRPETWPSYCAAVRRFSGFARDRNVAVEAAALAASLAKTPWANATGSDAYGYSIAQYDSPFRIIGRVNEVWVEISGCEVASS